MTPFDRRVGTESKAGQFLRRHVGKFKFAITIACEEVDMRYVGSLGHYPVLSSRLSANGAQGSGVFAGREERWIGSWYSSPMGFSLSFSDSTLRSVVHLTAGGERLRLRFSNLFGSEALEIGAVTVCTGDIVRPITFDGRPNLTIPPGEHGVSDPVTLKTTAGSQITVAAYYPGTTPRVPTMQYRSAESNSCSAGNTVNSGSLPPSSEAVSATFFLTAVDVESQETRGTIVVLGDSLTDGGVGRWPALLAERLSAAKIPYGVLNAAIGGNRLLGDAGRDSVGGYGGSSVKQRFQRDVLDQPGVRHIIVFEGINDVAVGAMDDPGPRPFSIVEIIVASKRPSPTVVEDVIGMIRSMATRAHQRGIKIYAATLMPFEGASASGFYTPEKNVARLQINQWIRETGELDGYFDFERAVADPAEPNRIDARFSADGHHLNFAGQQALSEAVDLKLLE